MSYIKNIVLAGAFVSVSQVMGHGTVSGIVADGIYYQGYSPSFQFQHPSPAVVGWSIPEDLSNGFIDPSNYTTAEVICHLGATPGAKSVAVKAGGSVELQWTLWPSSHHGPVIDYLANCNGPCSSVDKSALKFNKIDGAGLIDDTTVPGNWASDQLIANNNSWTIVIPASVAPGDYVLRHEIIALHSAGSANGAQNYPQCINLEITGAGTDTLASGTLGEALYTANDPGILVNIYTKLTSYLVPGPALYSGAVSTPQGNSSSNATVSIVPAPVIPTSVATPVATLSTVISPTTAIVVITTSATNTPTHSPITATAIIPSSSLAAPSSTPSGSACVSVASPIVSLASASPTNASTTSLPTISTGTIISNPSGSPPYPTKPLPAGTTLQDLLEWLQIMLTQVFRDGKKERRHARAF